MASPDRAREAEPIDDVIDWLKSQDFSCLGTQHVGWNADGTQGTASDRNDVRERYVIECDGNCQDLRPETSRAAVARNQSACNGVQ